MERGTFIVIEGTDGSGKGTQFKLLAEHLRAQGYEVATFDFPQYDQPSSHFVKKYLNGAYGSADEIGPYTSSLFYALDRFEAAPAIRKALKEGKVVLSNRFTGSSMGHQGTKFIHAEERRGYFIWLDNLEFEMLKIPRPDVSLVLRVPAEVSLQLIENRGKARDEHENLSHLQRAVNVYDDLCQLFPKDFQRIDCVRSGELLPIETVQDLIRHKVQPMLPPPPKQPAARRGATTPTTSASSQTAIPPQAETSQPLENEDTITLPQLSQLAIATIERTGNMPYKQLPQKFHQKTIEGSYPYYIPPSLPTDLKTAYCAHMDEIFRLYAHITFTLENHLKNTSADTAKTTEWQQAAQARAGEIARAVLPTAATTEIRISSGPAATSLARQLQNDQLHEVQQAGNTILAHTSQVNESRATPAPQSAQAPSLHELATNYLSENYAGHTDPVHLTGVWPRNELDLVPDMLYEHSNLPLKKIKEEVAGWPYEKRLAVFEAYLGLNGQPTHDSSGRKALEKAHYSWDVLGSFDAFLQIIRNVRSSNVEIQALTPRYGYDMPSIIEAAGLEGDFEACFDISLKLHSLLQGGEFAHEAQYATLLGHKVRYTLTYNANEAIRLGKELSTAALPHKPIYHELVRSMYAKLGETHPLIGESIHSFGSDRIRYKN